MKLIPIVATLSLLAAGCAIVDSPKYISTQNNNLQQKQAVTNERIPGRYSLLTPQATGVTSVYEDAGRTLIQFARTVPEDLLLVDAGGKVLRFERYGYYAVVPGQYEGILLRSGGGQSYATTADPTTFTIPENATKATAPATAVQPAAPDAPTAKQPPRKSSAVEPDDVDTRAQSVAEAPHARLSAVESQLRDLETKLTPAQKSAFSVAQIMQKIAALETKVDDMDVTIVRVRFLNSRTNVQLPDPAREAFKLAAEASDRIEVRGRTDSVGSVKVNSRIAYERAISAKMYLISLGVPAEKIRVSALPMTDYVADNASVDGRARNRRVDFVFVPPEDSKVRVSMEAPLRQ